MTSPKLIGTEFDRVCLYMSQNFPEPVIMALGFGDGYLYFSVN